MLRHALRRLLWVVPAVLGLTLLAFYVLSLLPDRVAAQVEPAAEQRRDELARRGQRERPLFLNLSPADVSTKTEAAVHELTLASPDSDEALRAGGDLVRLGGAALPFVLPDLDALEPDARGRVARALVPLAERMGVAEPASRAREADPVMFWTRFWETRGTDFRPGTVRAAVRRFAQHGQQARAEELRVLDTYALEAIMEELRAPSDRAGVARAARLVELAAVATGRDDRISVRDDPDVAARCVERWQAWWRSYEADFTTRRGVGRFAAIVLDTRFGGWTLELIATGIGEGTAGEPRHGELLRRVRLSATLLLLALALAYAAAIPLGAWSAFRKGTGTDRMLGWLTLAPHVGTAALLGVAAVGLGWAPAAAAGLSPGRLGLAAALLALGLIAEPSRQLRAALLPALTEPHVQAALARGVGPRRLLFVHALRSALVPLCARAPLEPAAAWTGVFVLELAFGLPGLGEATVRALGRGETRWLMALVVLGAVWAVVSLAVGDLATALVDPRLRSTVLRSRRRSS